MKLTGKSKLIKLQAKNKGNKKLITVIDQLIADIELNEWDNPQQLLETRVDADRVHSDGFYFFNLYMHRTLILIEFDENSATVVWTGTHDDYESTFRNNKATIKSWLRKNEWI